MNATTETTTINDNKVTYTRAIGLYGTQANEWHVVAIRSITFADGRVHETANAWCNYPAKVHGVKEDTAPTTSNVTCAKCLKHLKHLS